MAAVLTLDHISLKGRQGDRKKLSEDRWLTSGSDRDPRFWPVHVALAGAGEHGSATRSRV